MKDPIEYIAFLEQASELEILASFCEQEEGRLSRIEIISLTMDINLLLEEKGFPFKSVWEVVGEDISVAVAEASGRLAEQWFIPIFKDCFYEVAAWGDYRFFFGHALACRTIVNRVLRDRHHKTVLLFPIVQKEISLPRIRDLDNGIFGAVLHDYVKGHHAKSLALAKPGLWQRMCLRINPWWQLALQIARDMKHCRRRRLSPRQGQEVDILFTNWGYDLERHVCIDEILEAPQLEDFKVGHIVCYPRLYNPPSSPVPANHFIYKLDLSLPSHLEYLSEFLGSVFVWKYLTFLLKRGRLRGDARFLLSIPNLGFQYLYFFFSLYRNIYLARKFMEKMIRESRPRVIVASDACVSPFRVFILTAEEKDIPVISVNHGYYLYVPPKAMFLADHCIRCIVAGEAFRQNLIEAGVDLERIIVAGNPRFSRVFPSAPSVRKTIIILTAGSGTWSSGKRFSLYQDTVSQLCEVLSADSRYEVVIKSHPWADYYTFYDRLIRKLSRPNLRQVQASLSEDMIKECSAVIFPGTISGSVLEFLQYQVPCIYLTSPLGEYQKRVYRMNGVGITLSDASEVKTVVDRLHEDQSFRASVIKNGHEFLRRHTELGDNSPSRFIEPILDVLRPHIAREYPSAQ